MSCRRSLFSPDGWVGAPASVIIVLGVVLAGCAGPKAKPPALPPTTQTANARVAPPTANETAKEKAAPVERVALLTVLADGRVAIVRPALRHLIARGAQDFIAKVDVRPAFRKRRFYGWRVLAYNGPGKLQRGDIVVRVNGRGIERPDQFIKVWFSLPDEDALVVEMVRRGQRVTRRFPIVDASGRRP